MTAPVITFMSDYGLEDEFVGVCHGVIATICPEARVIDLMHGVPRHDVRAGALILRASLRYLPVGVVLAVVDPGVGSDRRALAIRAADGSMLVGPDNGLLAPAASAAGGIVEAADIGASRFALAPVSATFHGRDLFAPVAARLAGGTPFAQVGEPIDPAQVAELGLPLPHVADSALVARAIHVDGFGNVQLDAGLEEARAASLEPGALIEIAVGGGNTHRGRFARTFADVVVHEMLMYVDARGTLAVAVNHGDAARRLGVEAGTTLRIRPA